MGVLWTSEATAQIAISPCVCRMINLVGLATKLGKQVMQQQAIDLIFATAPPLYEFVGRSRISKKRVANHWWPITANEWTGMRYRDTPSNFFNRFANGRLAASIITVAQPIADNLRKSGLLTAQTLQTADHEWVRPG